jgi:periplasmic divalent cation tolerance protein
LRVKIVLSNVPPERAEALAKTLVEERLAACVNLLPVRSVYRWKGELQQDSEVTLLIKVAADRVQPLRERLRALHPYDLPEIVVLGVEVEQSLQEYVDWVRAECKSE